MDGEDDFDGGGYEGGGDTAEPEDNTSRSDVEEAVISHGKLFSLATPALQPEFSGR
jgi:hypothetical protein